MIQLQALQLVESARGLSLHLDPGSLKTRPIQRSVALAVGTIGAGLAVRLVPLGSAAVRGEVCGIDAVGSYDLLDCHLCGGTSGSLLALWRGGGWSRRVGPRAAAGGDCEASIVGQTQFDNMQTRVRRLRLEAKHIAVGYVIGYVLQIAIETFC